ncbi:unnamed protein product [Meloidogyne enterolobii]|uniref:Uncharacterized protein n=1 Tax=Meloidogyne enterolobii TaxID=390850 RepID=A0ACB1A0P9_MELEN
MCHCLRKKPEKARSGLHNFFRIGYRVEKEFFRVGLGFGLCQLKGVSCQFLVTRDFPNLYILAFELNVSPDSIWLTNFN